MSEPLVSVVLPVRDGERFLAEAIESVLAQTCRPLELIVVDGGSRDRSGEIARSYDGVRYVAQAGSGLPDAFNQGIACARGTLLAFISSDDRWTVDKLQRQVDCLRQQPGLAYTIARFRFFLEPGCRLPRGFNAGLLDRDLVGRIPETLVARREAFEAVGRFSTAYAAAQDVEWFLRAQERATPMALVPHVLLHKRIHDRNLSSDAAVNTPALLEVLRHSLQRRRSGPDPDDPAEGRPHG
jgi:glycosyltransferase involved in cell wall biosynthesis